MKKIKMKKIGKYFIFMLMFFVSFGTVIYADEKLEIEYVNKYDEVYDVDYLINDEFKLSLSVIESAELPEGFAFFNACQRLDNTYESSDKCNEEGKRLVYIYPQNINYSANEYKMQDVPGKIVLTFAGAATLSTNTNTTADVVVTIENIKMQRYSNANMNQAIMILRQGDEYISNEANSSPGHYSVSYDITFELRKNGNKIEGKTMGIVFSDIDVYKESLPDYSEAIQLVSGIKDNKVYRLNDSKDYLCIDETNNSHFTAYKKCGKDLSGRPGINEKGNIVDNKEKFKAGMALRVDSAGFSYKFTGGGCGTDISFLTVSNPNLGEDAGKEEVKPEEKPDEPEGGSPQTGNVAKVFIILILLVVSGSTLLFFLRKNNNVD